MAILEVFGMAEAAEIVGVTKSNFSAHRKKYPQCPQPSHQIAAGPIWAGPVVRELRAWGKEFSKIKVTRTPREKTEEAPASKTSKAAPAKAAVAKKAAPAKKLTDPKNPETTVAAAVLPAAKKAAAATKPSKTAPAKKTPAKKGLFAGK